MSSFRRFQSDQTGSIMPIFGLIFILLLAVVALGVDVSNAVAERNRLQNAADMAAVTTARGLLTGEIEINEAQTYAENAFQQTATDFGKNAKSIFGKMKLDTQASASRKEENGSTVFTVQISGNAELPASPLSFMFFDSKSGKNTISLGYAAQSTAKSEKVGAFSMAMVLDKSGSMGWNNPSRIVELKKAVHSLVKELKDVDKDEKYTRLGAYSYDSSYRGRKEITWDKNAVQTWVNTLQAGGGTMAYSALSAARSDLLSSTETSSHKNKNGQEPQLFMLYMTDGDDQGKAQARLQCTAAKTAGITIFSVAFQAPPSGKTLLEDCASSPENFYDAKDADELNEVFKEIARKTAKSIPYVSG